MPGLHVVKTYVEGGFYHVYNRAHNGNNMFVQDVDYVIFTQIMQMYVSESKKFFCKSYSSQINILAYCLMPNHFHLLLQQKTTDGMTLFCRSLFTSYALYFNKKYSHKGGIFEGKLRAVFVNSDEYLLQVSRYIHLNPLVIPPYDKTLSSYPYSSYQAYLGMKIKPWINTETILRYFNTSHPQEEYKNFVEQK